MLSLTPELMRLEVYPRKMVQPDFGVSDSFPSPSSTGSRRFSICGGQNHCWATDKQILQTYNVDHCGNNHTLQVRPNTTASSSWLQNHRWLNVNFIKVNKFVILHSISKFWGKQNAGEKSGWIVGVTHVPSLEWLISFFEWGGRVKVSQYQWSKTPGS